MPQPGEVIVVKQFEFEDGSPRDKWFVVLNASDLEKPCIVLKTTSHPNRYRNCVKGCNKNLRCFFAPATWQPSFRVDTYIQLPHIYEFPASTLLRDCLAGRVEFKTPLTTNCFGQVKSCLAGFKDDIAPSHWNLIYKTKN
jgi:hypothetical protein